jgi:hypothetical protein
LGVEEKSWFTFLVLATLETSWPGTAASVCKRTFRTSTLRTVNNWNLFYGSQLRPKTIFWLKFWSNFNKNQQIKFNLRVMTKKTGL